MERLLTSKDMARIACASCEGCGGCCRGMGDTIHLDPYDVRQLSVHLDRDFNGLLQGCIGLHAEDGIILPHLKMGDTGACLFLGEDGRCGIHAFRPGFCRLFPLGRDYDGTSFRYFVVPDGCPAPQKSKVRIDRWLDVPELGKYEAFVSRWHYYIRKAQQYLAQPEHRGEAEEISKFILTVFYAAPYSGERDFYELFEIRMKQAESVFCE